MSLGGICDGGCFWWIMVSSELYVCGLCVVMVGWFGFVLGCVGCGLLFGCVVILCGFCLWGWSAYWFGVVGCVLGCGLWFRCVLFCCVGVSGVSRCMVGGVFGWGGFWFCDAYFTFRFDLGFGRFYDWLGGGMCMVLRVLSGILAVSAGRCSWMV